MKLIALFSIISGAAGFAGIQAPTMATSTPAAKANFERLRPNLGDMSIVAAGGWHAVEMMAEDPKAELVKMIVESIKESGGNINESGSEKLNACVGLLGAYGKGFDADLVDGEWVSVLNKSAKKSPKIQKIVAKGEKAGLSFSTFDTKSMQFTGGVKILGKGNLTSVVQYRPVGDGFTTIGKSKIILRRIMCDIVGASWKYWFFPRVGLPLKKKGGYLDFVYLDEDIRITKGNRGGLFVHFRPEFLESALN